MRWPGMPLTGGTVDPEGTSPSMAASSMGTASWRWPAAPGRSGMETRPRRRALPHRQQLNYTKNLTNLGAAQSVGRGKGRGRRLPVRRLCCAATRSPRSLPPHDLASSRATNRSRGLVPKGQRWGLFPGRIVKPGETERSHVWL
jgi:hypothetical protein